MLAKDKKFDSKPIEFFGKSAKNPDWLRKRGEQTIVLPCQETDIYTLREILMCLGDMCQQAAVSEYFLNGSH
jgi:hypothetical protein